MFVGCWCSRLHLLLSSLSSVVAVFIDVSHRCPTLKCPIPLLLSQVVVIFSWWLLVVDVVVLRCCCHRCRQLLLYLLMSLIVAQHFLNAPSHYSCRQLLSPLWMSSSVVDCCYHSCRQLLLPSSSSVVVFMDVSHSRSTLPHFIIRVVSYCRR